MLTISVQHSFKGPNIVMMRDLLTVDNSPVTIKWTNTKAERKLLRQYPDRDITLVVPDQSAMERTAGSLGIPYKIDVATYNACMKAINWEAGGKWRDFANNAGPTVARGAIVQLVASCLRDGNDPTPLRKLAVECMLDSGPMVEADILMHLRIQGAHV